MEKKIKLIDAAERVLQEDERTRDNRYSWLYFSKVLREMGFKVFVEFDGRMPSPEALFRTRREILNRRGKYFKPFSPEEGITIEKPGRPKGEKN